MSILDGFATSMLIFIPVEIDDVPEIHEIRTNRKKNYLTQIDTSIEKQYKYFHEYKKRNALKKEVYLKIKNKKNNSTCGFVRITNFLESYSLGWESLIIKERTPAPIGIEICFSFYFLTFDHLKRSILGPWLVTDKNIHMMKIHAHMGFVTLVDKINGASVLIVMRSTYEERKSKFLTWGFANEFHEN